MSKTYHLIGIGGIGMGTLASLMLAKGYNVTGSDLNDNELIKTLRDKGAKVTIGHSVHNIEKADVVVHSSAIRMSNPEMIEAVSRGIPVFKRAQMLAELLNDQLGITVAGAHGKTTTSSMISCLLRDAKLEPTTAVGGIINQGVEHAQLGSGKHMVAEVDESDGSFLYFKPHYSVITNIDFEHIDFYKTWDNIIDAYSKFMQCVVPGGTLIVCGDDKRLMEIVESVDRASVLYGFDDHNMFQARNIVVEDFSSRFDVFFKGNIVGSVRLNLPGRHNILNALAAIAIGYMLRIDFSVIAQSLENFCGVKRRFQQKANVNGIVVVDDYGHHPTEITATLGAAKSLGRSRVITVFQPHRYSRTRFLLNEFVYSLKECDYLILTDVYAASERPSDGATTAELFECLQHQMTNPVVYLPKDHINQRIMDIVQPGDLILTLGAGDITCISDDLAKMLLEQFSSTNIQKENRL